MILKDILAISLPCILVLLFTRVTYSYWVGFALTAVLIGASIYKGYTHNYLIIFLDVLSLLLGLYLSKRMMQRLKQS